MESTLDKQILGWLSTGDTGLSSETIAFWAGYDVMREDHSHPVDPADFNRCLKLLDAAPLLRERLSKMAMLNDTWARFVERWDEIEATFLEEVGFDFCKGKSAPKTYALMKSVEGT